MLRALPFITTMPDRTLIWQKLLGFAWEVLLNFPYSPELAPPDFYLFQFLRNLLNGQTFNYEEDLKIHLEVFFDN